MPSGDASGNHAIIQKPLAVSEFPPRPFVDSELAFESVTDQNLARVTLSNTTMKRFSPQRTKALC